MSNGPNDFLASAERMLMGANEIDLRNAASRAYYAAFHCCKQHVSMCPGLSEDDIQGSHDKLYKRFANIPSNDSNALLLKAMAYLAREMKSTRHDADYKLDEDFRMSDAKQQISDAKTVISRWKLIK